MLPLSPEGRSSQAAASRFSCTWPRAQGIHVTLAVHKVHIAVALACPGRRGGLQQSDGEVSGAEGWSKHCLSAPSKSPGRICGVE